MRIKFAAAVIAAFGLAGCMGNTTDAERALIGAAAGATAAHLTGNNVTTGALVGGAAGVVCDNAGVCR